MIDTDIIFNYLISFIVKFSKKMNIVTWCIVFMPISYGYVHKIHYNCVNDYDFVRIKNNEAKNKDKYLYLHSYYKRNNCIIYKYTGEHDCCDEVIACCGKDAGFKYYIDCNEGVK